MPEMDEGAFVLDYNMPVGTSLSQTDKVLRRVEAVLLKTPDIHGYIRRTGAELGFFATESYTGDILVSLKPSGERRPMSEIFDGLRDELKAEVPELETEFVPLVLDQIGDLAGVEQPIEVKIFGPEPAKLRELAEEVGKIVEKVEGVVDVNTHVLLGNPDIVVRPDSVQTARVGLSELEVESQLNAALYGQVASTIPEQDRMTKIRVRYPDRVRYNRENLGQLPISLAMATAGPAQSKAGIGFVPLSQLASIRVVRSPNELWRENQQPVLTVTAALDKRDLGSVNRELQTKLSEVKFPPGYRFELAGSYRAQQESFASLATVLVVSSALVFLLLGFQFHSLTLPVLIFLAQPVSLASALFALWITEHAAQRLVVHGGHSPDRIGRQERHHPDRVHRPAPERGDAAPRSARESRSDAVPSHPDDEPLHHPRPGPPGVGPWPRRPDAATAGDRRHRRTDHEHAAHSTSDPGRLPGLEAT